MVAKHPHISLIVGELAFTLINFFMLTGIPIAQGGLLEFNKDIEAMDRKEGWFPIEGSVIGHDPLHVVEGWYLEGNGMHSLHSTEITWLSHRVMTFLFEVDEHTYELTPDNENELARSFLFYLMSMCFFPTASKSLHLGWIEDEEKLCSTDWALAIYVYIIVTLDEVFTLGRHI